MPLSCTMRLCPLYPDIEANSHTKAQALLFIQLKLFFHKSFMDANTKRASIQ